MGPSKKIFADVTRRQTVEFGLVAVLAILFAALYAGRGGGAGLPERAGSHMRADLFSALVVTLLTIVIPRIFYPFAVVWFGLSEVLGKVSSFVLMSLVFFVIVLPVGLLRRWGGRDPLKLTAFKKETASALHVRRHVYVKEDLTKTF